MNKESKKSTVEQFKEYKTKTTSDEKVASKSRTKKTSVWQKIKDCILQNNFTKEDEYGTSPVLKHVWLDKDYMCHTRVSNPDAMANIYYEDEFLTENHVNAEYQYYKNLNDKHKKQSDKNKTKYNDDVIEM